MAALVCGLLFVATLFVSIHFPPAYRPGGEAFDAPVRVNDFAFMFNYSRYFIFQKCASVYSAEAHLFFMRDWMGAGTDWAMSFGWSPTVVLLMLPLMWLPTSWAWLVWTGISFIAQWVGLALWNNNRDGGLRLAWLCTFSLLAYYVVIQGQSAFFCVAMLMVCARSFKYGKAGEIAAVLALFALTFKPALALAAGVAFAVSGRARVAFASAFMGACVVAAATLWSGIGWIADYMALMKQYNLLDCMPELRAGYAPQLMTNLRSVFYVFGWLDDRLAGQISALCYFVALGTLVATGFKKKLRFEWSLGFSIVAYSLFAPQLTATEDWFFVFLHSMLLRDMSLGESERRWLNRALIVIVFFGGGTTWWLCRTFPAIGQVWMLMPLAFCGKLIFARVLLRQTWRGGHLLVAE